MKRLSLVAAVAALSLTGVAHAASTDAANIDLTATVAGICYVDVAGFSSPTLNFDSQINGTTALLTAVASAATTVTAYCNNTGTTLDITSQASKTGLTATVATIIGSGSFAGDNTTSGTSILPYTASGTWAGQTLADYNSDAGAAATEFTTANAINGTISLTVLLDSFAGLPVLEGAYTDTMVVTIATTP